MYSAGGHGLGGQGAERHQAACRQVVSGQQTNQAVERQPMDRDQRAPCSRHRAHQVIGAFPVGRQQQNLGVGRLRLKPGPGMGEARSGLGRENYLSKAMHAVTPDLTAARAPTEGG